MFILLSGDEVINNYQIEYPAINLCVLFVRDYIASNIEEHIEEYLGSIITYEDIA